MIEVIDSVLLCTEMFPFHILEVTTVYDMKFSVVYLL